jgi:hypothetical protein
MRERISLFRILMHPLVTLWPIELSSFVPWILIALFISGV